MPYIHPEVRQYFNESIDDLVKNLKTMSHSDQCGCFNYIMYRMAKHLSRDGGYAIMSGFRGAMHDSADEFYRRIMVPYEDEKINENGDVI